MCPEAQKAILLFSSITMTVVGYLIWRLVVYFDFFVLEKKWFAFRAHTLWHIVCLQRIVYHSHSWDFSMPFAMHVTRYVASIMVCAPCQIEKIFNPKIFLTGGIRTHHGQIANLTPLCIRLTTLTRGRRNYRRKRIRANTTHRPLQLSI